MYAVLQHGTQHPDQLAPYQQDLLRMYCDTILGAKTPVAAEKLDGYSPLLAQLSQEQIKDTVLPAAQKFVKRTPEAALVSMKVLFQALQLDLSSSLPDVTDQLLKLIRGSKESVRYSPFAHAWQITLHLSSADGPLCLLMFANQCVKQHLPCCQSHEGESKHLHPFGTGQSLDAQLDD